MEIEVYDTYATSEKGVKIHFDVMLPIGGNVGNASSYAQDFIKRIKEMVGFVLWIHFVLLHWDPPHIWQLRPLAYPGRYRSDSSR